MKSNKLYITLVVVLIVVVGGFFALRDGGTQPEVIEIGWVSDLTGPVAKWGTIEAARIAVDEINAAGGINGTPIKLIEEDGKCNPTAAHNAAKKLIEADKVKVILGGHCSPESLAIAPLAEANGVVMLAAVTSSPDLTDAGDYIFRTTQVSTAQVPVLAEYMKEQGVRKLGVVYEETSYAQPIAEKMKEVFPTIGEVVAYESYLPGTRDFRTHLTKLKDSGADAVFFSPQDVQVGTTMIQQMYELGLAPQMPIYGNEILAGSYVSEQLGSMTDGIVIGIPGYDETRPEAKEFIAKYTNRYGVETLPFGLYTAESYDSVHILADAIREAGMDPDGIRDYLYTVENYAGASGPVTIDENGDGLRAYMLRKFENGELVDVS